MQRIDDLPDAGTLHPMIDRLFHVVGIPLASIGAVAPHVEDHSELAKQIMTTPLAGYASVVSAIYLTLMVIKTAREVYIAFKGGK